MAPKKYILKMKDTYVRLFGENPKEHGTRWPGAPPSSPTSKLCSYDHLIEFPEVNVFSTILQKSKEIPKMCTIIVSFYQVLQDAIKFRGDEMRLLYLFCFCS